MRDIEESLIKIGFTDVKVYSNNGKIYFKGKLKYSDFSELENLKHGKLIQKLLNPILHLDGQPIVELKNYKGQLISYRKRLLFSKRYKKYKRIYKLLKRFSSFRNEIYVLLRE